MKMECHYLALIRAHDVPSDTDEGRELEAMRKTRIRAQVAIINYALRPGYSY